MNLSIRLFIILFCMPLFMYAQVENDAPQREPIEAEPAQGLERSSVMSKEEQEAAWMKLMQPGAEHEKLQSQVGTYTWENKMWTEPGAPPMTAKGTTSIESIMDGRFTMEFHDGEMMGMPFEGYGINGYNNATKQYESIWMDNAGTGITKFTGNYNDLGQLVMDSEVFNPMTRRYEKNKIVLTDIEGGFTMEYFIVHHGGENKLMEVKYIKD